MLLCAIIECDNIYILVNLTRECHQECCTRIASRSGGSAGGGGGLGHACSGAGGDSASVGDAGDGTLWDTKW